MAQRVNAPAPGSSPGVGLRVDTSDFARLLGKSSQVDKKLKTALRRNIRLSAQEAASEVRRALDAPPVTRAAKPRSTGLRDAIAQGVGVKVLTGARAGVSIVASASRMPEGKSSLVRAWESSKGWRHPVFGRDEWVSQKGNPYFRSTIMARRASVRHAVEAAMNEAAKSLE